MNSDLEAALDRLFSSAAPAYVPARCHPCVMDRHGACNGSAWAAAVGQVLVCSCDCHALEAG